MTPMSAADQGALVAVSAALGAGTTALARMFAGNRRTDKVDAVTAVAAAYDRLAANHSAQLDDMLQRLNRSEDQVDYLNRELRKRDEMILQYLGDPATRAHAAELAAEKLTKAAAHAAASVLTTAAERVAQGDTSGGRRADDTSPESGKP